MTSDEIAAARAIWHRYLDQLRDAGDQLFRPGTPSDEVTVAEGLRHLGRITRLGLIAQMEYADPDFPVLAQYVDDVTKFGCDNPDTIYQRAVLNGNLRYRIVGRRNTVDYLSFITARPGENGRQIQIAHLDTANLAVAPDGRFEIVLSPEPQPGNWLQITPDTRSVSVRQTFLDRSRETAAELRIERLGERATPPPLTMAAVSQGFDQAGGFTAYIASLFPDWTHGYLAHINALPPADQEACLRAGGDPNIYFYRSVWQLGPRGAGRPYSPHSRMRHLEPAGGQFLAGIDGSPPLPQRDQPPLRAGQSRWFGHRGDRPPRSWPSQLARHCRPHSGPLRHAVDSRG